LFNSPQGVAVHPLTQDVYVCDFFNHSIRKIEKFLNTSSSQTMTTFSGAGPSSAGHVDGTLSNARFHNPSGIVIAKNGDMYISDRANHVIRKIAGNSVTTLAGSPGLTGKTDGNATSARFNLPEGLFLQGDSLLLIADFGNKSIRAINLATNEVTTVIGTGLNNPRSLTMAGNALFITDLYRILVYHDKQLSPYAGAETPDDINGFGLQARFGELMGITFYPNDSALLVVDEGYNVLKSVSIDKKYFTDNSNPDLQVPTILQASFSLYPNPAQTEIQLRSSFASNESLQIKLIDSKGTSLKEWKQSASYTNVLSIVELNAGLYFLKVNGEMGTSQVLRFIKE
jgi:DNA-binding beta-propeller fold protein YncE